MRMNRHDDGEKDDTSAKEQDSSIANIRMKNTSAPSI